ncbi:hypothetical protein [Salipiger sp. PrR007]|uniref:hypothetical protein n=1 Tax=Salipiger sp. PrR007 TaxID=2706884 RepID=UPI0013BC7E68|nr:hypothetical protein [Salipiger sp. PrR007]NDW31540.1 hypothetical protein [Salipiger sp. PrR007]
MTNSLTNHCAPTQIALPSKLSEREHRKSASLPPIKPDSEKDQRTPEAPLPSGWWAAILIFGIIVTGGMWVICAAVEQLGVMIRVMAAFLEAFF